ncbi:Protein CBG11950 [Caenorhabditis briggsae]|nr:Protein CBG11950 [Caenorhabditis briggsae]CAP31003.2 Protein CBG11950 [Caenorhabditis briggsae]
MKFWPTVESKTFFWSNQEKNIGQWIKHTCSIFRCGCYEVGFSIGKMTFDNKHSLRNTFPKLRKIVISCEPNEQNIQSTHNVLKAFQPETVHLYSAPLQENLQHTGMRNLKELEYHSPHLNPRIEDLLTMNVERCTILGTQFSLRDLNRFFKLWTKGSNRRLKYLLVHGEGVADWNVLMKGLQAEEARRIQGEQVEREKEHTIMNCYGICGTIKLINIRLLVSVELTVLN